MLNLVVAMFQAPLLPTLLIGMGIGVSAGWLLYRRKGRIRADHRSSDSGPADTPEAVGREYEQEVLMRLHEASASVVQHVREYNSKVELIAKSLESSGGDSKKKQADAARRAIQTTLAINTELEQRLTPAMREIEDYALEIESQMANALTDSLTGIPNRRAFDQELWRRFAEWKRQHTPFSVMLIDADHFRKLYNQYGDEGGDEFLRQVAHAVSQTMRDMDLVARFSPGALAAILPATDLKEAIKTAERVRAALPETRIEHEGCSHRITVSIGMAESIHGDNAASLLRRTDAALYAAKEAGRNCVFVSTGASCEPSEQALRRLKQRPETETSAAGAESGSLRLPASKSEIDQPPCHASATDPRIDALTGLPNRQSFCEALRPRLAEWRRHKIPLSLMLVEIDELARLEKKFGKEACNLALRAVPQFLTAAMRESDQIGRFDDGKFVVLLAQNDAAAATTVAERIRTAISSCDTLRLHKATIRFTASIGVAEATGDDGSVALIMRAEAALRAAKNAGSDCTFVHDGVTCVAAASADAVKAASH